MSEKKLITVFGATGAAGGSVAKYLLEDGTFTVRAVTRNATSAAAVALKAKGAEVAEADMNKPETLAAAVAGAYGVLGMTDFWTLLPGTGWSTAKAQELEEVQGRAVIDAAKAAGVKHFVFLSLPDGDCPHFAGKAKIARYLAESGLPYTTLVTSIYYENISAPFEKNFMFGRNEDGSLVVKVPSPADSYITLYSVEQTGGWVLAVLKNSEQWLGKELWVIGERIKAPKIAEVLTKAIGKPVGVRALTTDEFYALGNTTNVVAKEIHMMMTVVHEHFQPPDQLYVESISAAVYPDQQDFETFVRENENFKKFLATL